MLIILPVVLRSLTYGISACHERQYFSKPDDEGILTPDAASFIPMIIKL
jgi:hypothetical protein